MMDGEKILEAHARGEEILARWAVEAALVAVNEFGGIPEVVDP
jgi:hypothetical protein